MKESSRSRRALDHNLPRVSTRHDVSLSFFIITRIELHIFLQLEFSSNVALFTIFVGTTSVPVCKYLSNVASSQRGRGNTRTRYGAKNFEMHKGGRRVRRAEKPGLVRRVKLLTRLEGNSRDEIVQSACCLSFPSSLRDCP